jgi:hypothetical protein
MREGYFPVVLLDFAGVYLAVVFTTQTDDVAEGSRAYLFDEIVLLLDLLFDSFHY